MFLCSLSILGVVSTTPKTPHPLKYLAFSPNFLAGSMLVEGTVISGWYLFKEALARLPPNDLGGMWIQVPGTKGWSACLCTGSISKQQKCGAVLNISQSFHPISFTTFWAWRFFLSKKRKWKKSHNNTCIALDIARYRKLKNSIRHNLEICLPSGYLT